MLLLCIAEHQLQHHLIHFHLQSGPLIPSHRLRQSESLDAALLQSSGRGNEGGEERTIAEASRGC
ncbi:unnamed protein product [Amoebophrya sp. A25]|nr:unnamed protein product [Amoebophrya sp. A25]|eukprot:GSA25T00022832001.1